MKWSIRARWRTSILMNLIMTDAEELSNGKPVGKFGRVIVRGNNVLFIKLQDDF